MHILIYVGSAPSREQVISASAPIVQKVATSVTLVANGNDKQVLLDDAQQRLAPPEGVAVTRRLIRGNAQSAILEASRERSFDLVIFGRFHQPIGRLLPGAHSKAIAQRLEPSVLRVHGTSRPLRRILLASGGDHHTFDDVRVAARLAAPFGASVTLLHVISQQSLLFEGFSQHGATVDAFLNSSLPEANVIREAKALLERRGVEALVKGRVGPVLDEILAELRIGGYDLLVIGAHRVASALDRILFEDITDDLLDVSQLPVLVVKGAPDE
jgi:nucleotide-binding universal stress UspA family protein